jgi:5-methylcytosine-specific restriction endonuclease McrA
LFVQRERGTEMRSTLNGGKWIRPTTRLAILLRDNLACAYCRASLEDGTALSVEHLQARDEGGGNDPTNLVTACVLCNSRRGGHNNEALGLFIRRIAGETGEAPRNVRRRIERLRLRPLDPYRGATLAAPPRHKGVGA